MSDKEHPPDASQKVEDLSEIKNPRTYFETVRKLMMCPGSSFASIKKSKIC
jgi:hypothetical protein